MENNELENLLQPMFYLLDKKNITDGVSYIVDNNKFYFCFDKDYLSEVNLKILVNISSIYCDNFFYTDDNKIPNDNHVLLWIPDEWYDEKYKVSERCSNKKYIVLELDYNDKFTILGTTIMLANVLQEQNPLDITANKNRNVFTSDELKRESHYLKSGCPDLSWIDLLITLNKDNSLYDNPYAQHDKYICVNTCDNVERKTIYFNMDCDNLKNEIKKFFNDLNNSDDLDAIDKIDCQKLKKLLPQLD